MVPNRRQAIIWTYADLIHWRIYAALGGDELNNDYHGVMSLYNNLQRSFVTFGINQQQNYSFTN